MQGEKAAHVEVANAGVHWWRQHGGATMAANAGVQDRLFKQHGLWKSESAKNGYGTDSAQIQVKVSQKAWACNSTLS